MSKEKIQQTDNGQRNDVERQTAESQVKVKNKKKRLLYALAFSVLVALFFMSLATAVNCEIFAYLFNVISSAGYISAAVCLTWLICFGGVKNIGLKKQIVKAVATAIFFFGAVLLSVATWGSVLNQNFEDALFWLVAISWTFVSALIIVKQISLEKQDFEEKPVMSYLFILCGMIYAFAYAVILKFNFDLALKIFYTIHTVVALTVFINIIFKYGIKASNFLQLALFIVSIIVLMALLVSTLYFWFWDSYDPEIFTSIMGVFAGLLGGVLTLTGVAWTIKRQEETRREEERQKYIPYLVRFYEYGSEKGRTLEFTFRQLESVWHSKEYISIDTYKKLKKDKEYIILSNFYINLINSKICILLGIEINGEEWLFNNRSLLTDTAVALISSGYIYEVDKVKSIKLIAEDAIGNKYLYNTKFVRLNERNFMVRDDNHNILDNPEYKEIKYKSIELKEIGLPILLNDDKGIPNDNN